MAKTRFALLFMIFLTSEVWAQGPFKRGTQEVGLTNLGIGYSNVGGFMVSANTRYQYYVLDRFALGGFAFYNNFNDREWMGLGPAASYILFTYRQWFSRIDQLFTAAKFNGFRDEPADFYGTSSISVNYLPERSNFFIGVGFAHTYALNEGRVLFPNALQVFAGWLWR